MEIKIKGKIDHNGSGIPERDCGVVISLATDPALASDVVAIEAEGATIYVHGYTLYRALQALR